MEEKFQESDALSSSDSMNTHNEDETESMPQAGLRGHLSGQCDLEPPNTTQHSTTALGTQSQHTSWKKHKEIMFKPILCVRSNSAIILITWLRGRKEGSNNP